MDAGNNNYRTPRTEGIDFGKLWMIIRNNWIWIAGIILLTNTIAYLKIRYTPDLYESRSELKLDIKDEASELGIKSFVEDQNLNVISGEIELIQSRLFLSQVLDSLPLDVAYYNSGEILNHEFFGNAPFEVHYNLKDNQYFNIPIFLDELPNDVIKLRFGTDGKEEVGKYGSPISLPGLELLIYKNENFQTGGASMNYFFVINSRDVLLDYLSRSLSVEPLNYNANTIRISFKDKNPYKAYTLINNIDSLYLQYSYDQKNLANKQKIDWLVNELTQIEDKMASYENYFENFILQNKTNNLDEDLVKTVELINQLDSQRYDLTRRIQDATQLGNNLSSNTYFVTFPLRQSLPKVITDNLDLLHKLTLDLEKLKLSYSENTFAVRQREKEIESIRMKVAEQIADVKKDWLTKLNDLNNRKAQLESEFANMPDKNTQYNKNQRFYKLYEEFYLLLMQSKSEFEIAQAGSTPDFKILSPATLPRTPISPNKLLIMGIGFVAGIVLNFFFIGVLYVANNKITGVQELEKLSNVPVLGIVPASRYSGSHQLHVVEHPKSMVSEAIRTLRTNLDFFGISAPIRTITISSTVSGEGKSFIALNLGGIITLSRKRVVLLDLDMRKPKTTFPAAVNDPSKGVSTILIKKHSLDECICATAQENFDYIPPGPQPPNPSELLLNGEFLSMIEELKKRYDYIIMDTPPVGLVTDGIMAMKQADMTMYIFRADYSKKEFIANLQRIISINKFANITTILNALPVVGKASYGYGYYEENKKVNKLKSLFTKR